MKQEDSTGINFVRSTGEVVVPLLCPRCGSATLEPYQALTHEDRDRALEECIVAVAHYECRGWGGLKCSAKLMVRVERHRVLVRWSEAE